MKYDQKLKNILNQKHNIINPRLWHATAIPWCVTCIFMWNAIELVKNCIMFCLWDVSVNAISESFSLSNALGWTDLFSLYFLVVFNLSYFRAFGNSFWVFTWMFQLSLCLPYRDAILACDMCCVWMELWKEMFVQSAPMLYNHAKWSTYLCYASRAEASLSVIFLFILRCGCQNDLSQRKYRMFPVAELH